MSLVGGETLVPAHSQVNAQDSAAREAATAAEAQMDALTLLASVALVSCQERYP